MQGCSQRGATGATGAFAPPPPPFFPERQEFYLYLNEFLPQIVVLTLGNDHTEAGNKAVLIADSARAHR